MLDRLRSLVASVSPTREGRCVVAMLELEGLGRLAESCDAARFSLFLSRAPAEADRLARARGGCASAVEAGTFLAGFPARRGRTPALAAVEWVLETRRALAALAREAAPRAPSPRFAAGIACGRGTFGRRAADPAVAGEPAHFAARLLAAARAYEGVFADEEAAAELSARHHLLFERVPAVAGTTAFVARRLLA